MTDTAWKIEPIYRPIDHARNNMAADGYSDVRIFEAFLAVALSGMQHLHGSINVSQRLYVLALKFAEEADRHEAASAGAGGCVH
jgi:hypothetical protein